MSVLNQSGEELVECPLCMEPLEVDDLHFYPCTCGYQICRFCWHRIRTDENGLCPACRKAYSEDPADFTPLSREQVAKLKADKRHRDQQRKAKLSESRKHLASVRVVQRNLVFVVGLPVRLADAELLKKHEYFGKFGKIHKVVINQSTSYAGSQGPSASAYVTYMKSDDALRAIQSVNNIVIDGRPVKSSLGTTKYCSHFMKNQPCPKADCMYLHEMGDPEASFTKEQMHAGKHQEYERKLHEQLLAKTQQQQLGNGKEQAAGDVKGGKNGKEKEQNSRLASEKSEKKSEQPGKEKSKNQKSGKSKSHQQPNATKAAPENSSNHNNNNTSHTVEKSEKNGTKICDVQLCNGKETEETNSTDSQHSSLSHIRDADLVDCQNHIQNTLIYENSKLGLGCLDDNSSFFSQHFHVSGAGESKENEEQPDTDMERATTSPSSILKDSLPTINTTEDWAAAFGFSSSNPRTQMDQVDSVAEIPSVFPGPAGLPMRQAFSGGADFKNGLQIPPLKSTLDPPISNRYFDSGPPKAQDNIMDVFMGKNGYVSSGLGQFANKDMLGQPPNGINGLDQNMSKFFMDFHKGQQQSQQKNPHVLNGGMNGLLPSNGFGSTNTQEHLLLLQQQKQIEEQLINLSLKQHQTPYGSRYMNGTTDLSNGFGNARQMFLPPTGMPPMQNALNLGTSNSLLTNSKTDRSADEDELDFDPFQETQKGLAELLANEQSLKTNTTIPNRTPTGMSQSSQLNGLVHSQSAGHLPPPPPGFIQSNTTHMNSFGSKILPFLNMSNNQQISNSSHSNWTNGYSSQKNVNLHNDWKNLDPAILSSSRHYNPLIPSVPAVCREVTNNPYMHQPQTGLGLNNLVSNIGNINGNQSGSTTGTNSPQLRAAPPAFEYQNGAPSSFMSFASQIHNGYGGQTSWFGNDFGQISSPPGFRNSQTKQQEC